MTDQFWNPQIPYVLETGGTDDGETEQEHILEQISACQPGQIDSMQFSYSFRIRKFSNRLKVLLPLRVPELEIEMLPIDLEND